VPSQRTEGAPILDSRAASRRSAKLTVGCSCGNYCWRFMFALGPVSGSGVNWLWRNCADYLTARWRC